LPRRCGSAAQRGALSRAVSLCNRTTVPATTEYSIAAKVHCTRIAFEVASNAIQLMGGYGLSKEFHVEKIFRDARASMVEDGSNEVLGLVAARRIMDGYKIYTPALMVKPPSMTIFAPET